MRVAFDDKAVWVGERESVFLHANVDGQRIRCFVSREALDDHFDVDGDPGYVAKFNANRQAILEVAERLIHNGRAPPDSDLLISTTDF